MTSEHVAKKPIGKCVALWISENRAIIVSLNDRVEKILRFDSKGRAQGKDRRKRPSTNYYHRVIRAIKDAQEIFIFGPAQAKMELKSEILKVETLSHRVVGTETADAMTENELVERAREMCKSRAVQQG